MHGLFELLEVFLQITYKDGGIPPQEVVRLLLLIRAQVYVIV